ncbi:hypothetical protein [Chitinophaga japonensis]|uniref:BZIP transcription factor n=1 Tax=Chitinophaga japonensis TaxID=104662 RepID=A0A562SZR9_CHIJA|nr:hypothetical protein [Chitinophaga japonensis]TWI86603.1 hypothetical protein LX66_3865 [Chitinophaga japonensis]
MKKILLFCCCLLALMQTYAQTKVLDYDVTSFNFDGTLVNGAKIKTNLPFTDGSQMPTIIIEGYAYGSSSPIGLILTYYIYGGVFYQPLVSSFGAVTPPIYLANEGGKVVIFIERKEFHLRFNVRAFAQGRVGDVQANYDGWAVVDESISASATGKVLVPYRNRFAGDVFLTGGVWNKDSKVGIGTTSPSAQLNVQGGAIRLSNPGGYPYGMNIDVDYPSGWAREFSISHGSTGKMFSVGAFGSGNTLTYGYIGGNTTADAAQDAPWMVFKPDGNVGIGTVTPGAYKLAVKGTIGAQKVKVTQQGWADFVFQPGYQLPSLYEIEKYIKANRHLPGIPTAAEVEKEGLDLGEMDKKLLQKIEEQTLYLIELNKKIDALQQKNALLQGQVDSLSNK